MFDAILNGNELLFAKSELTKPGCKQFIVISSATDLLFNSVK